jgi:hypothetical protein
MPTTLAPACLAASTTLLPFRLGDLNVGDVQRFADVIAKQRESGTVFRNITAEGAATLPYGGIVKTLLALQAARYR